MRLPDSASACGLSTPNRRGCSARGAKHNGPSPGRTELWPGCSGAPSSIPSTDGFPADERAVSFSHSFRSSVHCGGLWRRAPPRLNPAGKRRRLHATRLPRSTPNRYREPRGNLALKIACWCTAVLWYSAQLLKGIQDAGDPLVPQEIVTNAHPQECVFLCDALVDDVACACIALSGTRTITPTMAHGADLCCQGPLATAGGGARARARKAGRGRTLRASAGSRSRRSRSGRTEHRHDIAETKHATLAAWGHGIPAETRSSGALSPPQTHAQKRAHQHEQHHQTVHDARPARAHRLTAFRPRAFVSVLVSPCPATISLTCAAIFATASLQDIHCLPQRGREDAPRRPRLAARPPALAPPRSRRLPSLIRLRHQANAFPAVVPCRHSHKTAIYGCSLGADGNARRAPGLQLELAMLVAVLVVVVPPTPVGGADDLWVAPPTPWVPPPTTTAATPTP